MANHPAWIGLDWQSVDERPVAVVTIEMWKRFYDEYSFFLSEMYEYGGLVSVIDGELRAHKILTGREVGGLGGNTDKITNESGEYTFHAHPPWCDNAFQTPELSCYPSDSDLISWIGQKGAFTGHLILTRTGIICGELMPEAFDLINSFNPLSVLRRQQNFLHDLINCTSFDQVAEVSLRYYLKLSYVYGEKPTVPIEYDCKEILAILDQLISNELLGLVPESAPESPPEPLTIHHPWYDQPWDLIPREGDPTYVDFIAIDWAEFYARYQYLTYAGYEYAGRASVIRGKFMVHALERGGALEVSPALMKEMSSKSSHFCFRTHPVNYTGSNFPSDIDIVNALALEIENSNAAFILTGRGVILLRLAWRGVYTTPLKIVQAQLDLYRELVGSLSFDDLVAISAKYGITLSYIHGTPQEGTWPFTNEDSNWISDRETYMQELLG